MYAIAYILNINKLFIFSGDYFFHRVFNMSNTQPTSFDKLFRGTRLAESILQTDKLLGHGIVFGQEFGNRRAKTAINLMFFHGDYRASFFEPLRLWFFHPMVSRCEN